MPQDRDKLLSQFARGAFIEQCYKDAGTTPDAIDSGAVILTGEAIKKSNAAAIDELMERLAGDGRPFHKITKRDFAHPALDADLAALLDTIKTGPGIVVMRGFPVDKYTPEEMQRVYWGIGAHFGHGCSQSADGDYLGHVTNVAKASRGYTTDRELSLHTDSAEIVGLLCVRDAKEGGMSIYASSLKVHEIIAREHPDYLSVLARDFRCDRRGEEAPDDEPWLHPYTGPSRSDVDATTLDGKVLCGYQGWFRAPGDPAGGGWVHWSRDRNRISPCCRASGAPMTLNSGRPIPMPTACSPSAF